jgi:hypothetical protein
MERQPRPDTCADAAAPRPAAASRADAPGLEPAGAGLERLRLTAASFGHPPAELTCDVQRYDRARRAWRAAAGAGAMLAGALLSLPIPGWHFVAVPGFLVAAVALAIRRLEQTYSVAAIHGPCPACGGRLRPLLPAATRFPCTTSCPSCRSFLKLSDLR